MIEGLLGGVGETLFPSKVPQGAAYDLDSMRMARAALLGNLGASLIAAGQGGQSPESRAAHLARMGNGVGQASDIMSQGVNNRLQAERIAELQAERQRKAQEDAFFRNSVAGIGAGGGGLPSVAPTAAPVPPSAGAAAPPVEPPATTVADVAARTPAPPPVADPAAVTGAVRPNGKPTWWQQLGIQPEMAVQIANLPSDQRRQVMQKLILDRATPREVWRDVTDADGKLLGQRNSATGKFERNGPQTEVNINSEKGWNELDQKRVGAAYETLDQREKTIMPQLRAMHGMLVSGQADPNALQPYLMPVREMLAGMGLLSPEAARQLSDDKLFDMLSSQVVPNMRPVGTGASSDRDISLFIKSLPGIGSPRDAALMGTAFMIQSQAYQRARTDLMQQYARTNKGGLVGFETFAEQKLGPVIPAVQTGEELAALPKGTLFKDPRGRFQVKVTD